MGMYGTTGGVTSDVRMEEKAEMIQLNNKLAAYMQKVRQLGTGGTDSVVFMDTLKSMEEEVRKLKAMYENELERCRQKLDEANRQKNNAMSDLDKYKRAAGDFEDRCRVESDKNRQLMKQLNDHKQRIAELDRELTNARAAAQDPQIVLNTLKKDLAIEKARNKELANQLDEERSRNKQLEDKIKALQQKLDFNGELSNEQLKDTTIRLEQAKKVIKDMEAKNRDLEKQQDGLPEVLAKMRRNTDDELAKYKADMENNNKKNNDLIKRQLDEQNRTLEQLKADNAKLEKENHRLMGIFRTMEAKIKELNCQNAQLEEQNRLDRSKSLEQIRKLEQQLKELQNLLMDKMQEINAGRDVQVSLKAEIDHYRLLLDEEEKRLNARGTNSPTGYSRGNLSTPASGCYSRALSANSDRANAGDKLGTGKQGTTTRKPGQGGKYDPQTEYQFAYNKYGGRTYHYGDSGLFRRTKTGLPTLATGRGNSGTGNVRCSMPN